MQAICKQTCDDKIIVFKDKKGRNKMHFNNPEKREITKGIVDGCLITKGKRCDFLLIDHESLEHFIELKGTDILYACEQIEESIKQLSQNPSTSQKHSFVVSTAVPQIRTELQILKKKFKSQYNSSLTVKNKICEHSIK